MVMQPMRDRGGEGAAVPVLFAIPFESQETSRSKSQRDIEWRLELSAKMPGVDYKSRFDVPVFKTADSRPDFKLDESRRPTTRRRRRANSCSVKLASSRNRWRATECGSCFRPRGTWGQRFS